MPKNILVEVTPTNKATGLPVTLRLSAAWADDTGVNLNNQVWLPLITEGPKQSTTLFSEGAPQEIAISHGNITFNCHPDFDNLHWSGYVWDGALGRVWIGNLGDPFASYTQIFEGSFGPIRRKRGLAQVALLGAEASLDVPLLSLSYAGTGGAEGSAGLKGALKPWASGYCQNVDPVLVDAVAWVYQVHGYGPIHSVVTVYENALDLSAVEAGQPATFAGDFGSYASLAAATLTNGQWATCLSLGLFRLANEPSGKITADVQGAKDGATFASSVSTIAQHLIKTAGVGTSKIDAASLNVFSTKPWNFYSRNQVSVGEVARAAYHHAGGYLFPSSTGVFMAGDWFGTKTAGVLSQDRSSVPLVTAHEMLEAAPPFYRVKVGRDHNYSVHATNEISPFLTDATDEEARAAAAAAELAAQEAQAQADAALLRLDNMASDAVLERAEKSNLVREVSRINSEFAGIQATGTALQLNTETTNHSARKTALDNYLAGLSPAYDNLSADTPVVPGDFAAAFQNYYVARQALLNRAATMGTIVGYLTNENHSVAADATGTVQAGDLANAGGSFKVMSGLTDVTNLSTFSLVSAIGVTMAVNASTGAYTVSAMSANTGVATLRATFGNTSVDKFYTINKAMPGANGAPAKTLTILSDRQTISFTGAGVADPATQTTTFSTNKQNTTATVTWTVADATGVAKTPVTSFLSAATGDSVTMTVAQFTSARGSTSGVIVTGTLTDGTTITDRISVTRVQGGAQGVQGNTGNTGATGPAGSNAVSGYLSTEAHIFNATPEGVVSDFTGAGGEFKVFNGTTDVTSSATFANVANNHLTASINAAGVFSITAIGPVETGAWVDFTATYNGTVLRKRFNATKFLTVGLDTDGRIDGDNVNTGTPGETLKAAVVQFRADIDAANGQIATALEAAGDAFTDASALVDQARADIGGDITAIRASARSLPNLIQNGDFTNGLTRWERDGAGPASDIGTYYHNTLGTIGWIKGAVSYIASDFYPISPGNPVSLSFEGERGGGDGTACIQWLPGYGQTGHVAIPTQWGVRAKSENNVAPAGATHFRVVIGKGTATQIHFARVKVNADAVATNWSDEATVYQTNARVSATETAVSDGRFSSAQRVTDLEASVGLTPTTPGSLRARMTEVERVTTDGTFATSTRVSDLEVENRRQAPNLIRNGDFVRGFSGWGFEIAHTQERDSYQHAMLGRIAWFKTPYIYSDNYPAAPGDTLSFSFDSGGAADSYATIQWIPSYAQTTGVSFSNDWTLRTKSENHVAPAGTTAFRLLFFKGSADPAHISRVKVNYGPHATPWSDEATVQDTNSRITTVETATTDGRFATAERASRLEARSGSVPNLLPNSDFRDLWRGWETQWQFVDAPDTGRCALNNQSGYQFLVSSPFLIRANVSYSISFDGDGGSSANGGSSGVYLDVFDEINGHIGNLIQSCGGEVSFGERSWQVRKYGQPFTTAPTARYAKLIVRKAGTDYVAISRIKVNEGAATHWTDDAAARDTAGRIQTVETATTDGRFASASRVGLLEAQKVQLPNLLANSDFSAGTRGWRNGGQWTEWGVQDNPNVGRYVARYSTTDTSHKYLISDPFPVYGGQPYSLSFNGDGGTGAGGNNDGTAVYMTTFRADNSVAGDGVLYCPVNSRDWNIRQSATGNVPHDAVRATIAIRKGVNTDGLGVSRIMVNAGLTPLDWSDNATVRDTMGRIATVEQVTTDGTFATASTVNQIRAGIQNVTGNLLTNTDFESGVAPWRPGGQIWTALTKNAAGDDWRPAGENCIGMNVPDSAGNGYSDITSDQRIAVVGGKVFEFTVYVACHRANAELFIGFVKADGSAVYASSGIQSVGGGGRNLNGWTRMRVTGVSPSDTVSIFPIVRKHMTIQGQGWTDSWIWIARPMMAETVVGADMIPYSPGDSRQLTGQITDARTIAVDTRGRVQSTAGLTVQAGNRVSGMRFHATDGTDASYSSIDFIADTLRVWSPDQQTGLPPFEVRNNSVRMKSAFVDRLAVGTSITLGSGVQWKVAVQPLDLNVTDGQSVSFGYDLGFNPTLTWAANNLAPLNSGETYKLYADNLSPTGFIARLKIETPATPANVAVGPLGAAPNGPCSHHYYVDPHGRSSTGTYTVRVNGHNRVWRSRFGNTDPKMPIYEPDDPGSTTDGETWIGVYGWNGGAWVDLDTMYVGPQFTGGNGYQDQYFDLSQEVSVGSNISHIGVAITYKTYQESYIGNMWLNWQVQGSGGGQRSATPNGQVSTVTVRPRS
ncbi:hypothetical protein [Brevundimonas sp.]|uniref:hypothetical protein n=1 Tax=Brevundimonas sp. TaxID=1871086 RepID=UPI0035B1F7EF